MHTAFSASITFTRGLRPLCTRQHHARRAMRRCSSLRARARCVLAPCLAHRSRHCRAHPTAVSRITANHVRPLVRAAQSGHDTLACSTCARPLPAPHHPAHPGPGGGPAGPQAPGPARATRRAGHAGADRLDLPDRPGPVLGDPRPHLHPEQPPRRVRGAVRHRRPSAADAARPGRRKRRYRPGARPGPAARARRPVPVARPPPCPGARPRVDAGAGIPVW